MADIFVLGAGVVGMTSAYFLARKGHAVTVIDAGSAPAEQGASFGNGAQLSYSYTDALASPSLVRNLPKYLVGCDPAFRFSPTLSVSFLSWARVFLANASKATFENNTIEVLKLAMESRQGFAEIEGKIDFDHRRAGKLNLYSTLQGVRDAKALSRLKNAHGAQQVMLTPPEAIAREPALAAYGHPFVGALWSPLDEVGDPHRFCLNLRQLLQDEYGVAFRFDTRILGLQTHLGKLVAVQTDQGELAGGRAVIALGVTSADIAKTVGIKLPIWPMQGYSMTIPATALAPEASITDTSRKVVFCRLGDGLRIAGLADIGPRNGRFNQQRFNRLLDVAKGIFPEAGDYGAELQGWTGYRPMTPNSVPIVDKSKVDGVFLNCGHGSLGWTLSMGAASRLAEIVPR
ncbi:FAD-dependent oxidoreductase [Neorhizobium lilium]|uniref:FAD-dependent oxidoreductase n=1 Tax=Neorhizobium lilium TaxID=2503024 RepID=A0A3S3VTC6_9HYPH|nr:FAD-dependent oxidoreductase [Neorhizobium lilium]RWX81444.1 FAD-dependent oxidoreductase [Neorhizobium lilium]